MALQLTEENQPAGQPCPLCQQPDSLDARAFRCRNCGLLDGGYFNPSVSSFQRFWLNEKVQRWKTRGIFGAIISFVLIFVWPICAYILVDSICSTVHGGDSRLETEATLFLFIGSELTPEEFKQEWDSADSYLPDRKMIRYTFLLCPVLECSVLYTADQKVVFLIPTYE